MGFEMRKSEKRLLESFKTDLIKLEIRNILFIFLIYLLVNKSSLLFSGSFKYFLFELAKKGKT